MIKILFFLIINSFFRMTKLKLLLIEIKVSFTLFEGRRHFFLVLIRGPPLFSI